MECILRKTGTSVFSPVKALECFVIPDALSRFSFLGVLIANFRSFYYIFMSAEDTGLRRFLRPTGIFLRCLE